MQRLGIVPSLHLLFDMTNVADPSEVQGTDEFTRFVECLTRTARCVFPAVTCRGPGGLQTWWVWCRWSITTIDRPLTTPSGGENSPTLLFHVSSHVSYTVHCVSYTVHGMCRMWYICIAYDTFNVSYTIPVMYRMRYKIYPACVPWYVPHAVPYMFRMRNRHVPHALHIMYRIRCMLCFVSYSFVCTYDVQPTGPSTMYSLRRETCFACGTCMYRMRNMFHVVGDDQIVIDGTFVGCTKCNVYVTYHVPYTERLPLLMNYPAQSINGTSL